MFSHAVHIGMALRYPEGRRYKKRHPEEGVLQPVATFHGPSALPGAHPHPALHPPPPEPVPAIMPHFTPLHQISERLSWGSHI